MMDKDSVNQKSLGGSHALSAISSSQLVCFSVLTRRFCFWEVFFFSLCVSLRRHGNKEKLKEFRNWLISTPVLLLDMHWVSTSSHPPVMMMMMMRLLTYLSCYAALHMLRRAPILCADQQMSQRLASLYIVETTRPHTYRMRFFISCPE